MNTTRAKEIAASPSMANVTFNNIPIYIQNVDENNQTARIYPLEEPNNETVVSLSLLKEH
jgi:small acid-soluble spore protein H (minor)